MANHQDYATLSSLIAGVDNTARQAEAKWGVDRLPLLVSDDTRAKFFRQKAKWRFVLETAYNADTITRDMLDTATTSTAAMQRAYAVLDTEATAACAQPVSPDVWEVALDGKVIALVRTVAEAAQVAQDGRHLCVYTLDEVANLIAALPTAIATAKIEFPGAKITGPADRSWVKNGDQGLPF